MGKYFTRTVILLSLVSLFTDISSELLYPVLPFYLQRIGFSVIAIGLLEGVANVFIGISTGYFGVWSDRTGDRLKFVRIGYFMSAIGKPLMIFSMHPIWIVLSRITERLGKGVRTGARDALLLNETQDGNAGKVFGFHRAMDTAGAVIGPLLALLYLHFHSGDYKSLFIIAFFPAIIGVLFTLVIKSKKDAGKSTEQFRSAAIANILYPFKLNKSLRRIFTGLLFFSLFNSADAYLFLICKLKGLSDESLIFGYVGYNLIYALFAMPMGDWSDRFGPRNVFVAGLIFFALAYFIFAVSESILGMVIAFALYGISNAGTEGVSKAWLSKHIGHGQKATVFGALKAITSIGLLLASAISGWVWIQFSPVAAMLLAAIGAIITAGLLVATTSKN